MDTKFLAVGIIIGLVVGIAGGFFVVGGNVTRPSTQTTTVIQATTASVTRVELGGSNKTVTTTQTYVAYSTEIIQANSSEIASLQSQVDALQIQVQDLRNNITQLQEIAQLGATKGLTSGAIDQSQGGTYSVSYTLPSAGLLSITLYPEGVCAVGTNFSLDVEVSWSRATNNLTYDSVVNLTQPCASYSSPAFFVVLPSVVTISVRDPNYQPFQAGWTVQYIY